MTIASHRTICFIVMFLNIEKDPGSIKWKTGHKNAGHSEQGIKGYTTIPFSEVTTPTSPHVSQINPPNHHESFSAPAHASDQNNRDAPQRIPQQNPYFPLLAHVKNTYTGKAAAQTSSI
ncbi:MAG: hypothetical protein EOL87_14870 [Spartobacteria bacterium]|nr:hypothetical protein [Spartobacteria bacterium]